MIYLQGFIVRNVNVTDISGSRGISTFCTESGLFGGLLVSFLIINEYFFISNEQSKRNYRLNFILLFIMLIATKSGTGYMLFILFVLLKLITISNYKFYFYFFIFVSLLILLVIINPLPSGISRGYDIMILLVSNPIELLTLDLSILTRITALFIGIVSVFYYPFGVGINDINESTFMIINSYDFLKSFPKFFISDSISLVSSFSTLTIMFGLFWWFFFVYIFFILSKTSTLGLVFSIIFLLFSYSAAFPLIWILLNLKKRCEK